MNLFKQLLVNNLCYKANAKLNVKGVMWHSTGANNPNLKRYVQPDDGRLGTNSNGNHWNTSTPGGRSVCVHAFIGKLKDGTIATYQTLPWTTRGWHAGGTANNTHIGFEICEDGLTDAKYFNAVYKEACELTAYLCKEFNLDPMADGVVICHSEGAARKIASNHADVMHWFKKHGKTMNDVRKDVKALMGTSIAAQPQPDSTNTVQQASTNATQSLYKVQTVASYYDITSANAVSKQITASGTKSIVVKVDNKYKVQCGAYKVRKNAEAQVVKLKKLGYSCSIY